MIKAIETIYKGYRFRSRLEARWAVFFDALNTIWQYEPEGYVLEDGSTYLPDFWFDLLPGNEMIEKWGFFVEIKPCAPTDAERQKLHLLAKGTRHTTMCFWGEPSEDNWHVAIYKGQGDGELYMYDGKFSVEWLCFEETKVFNIFMHHTPFGYLWEAMPAKIQAKYLTRAFSAFRAARFEFGEKG